MSTAFVFTASTLVLVLPQYDADAPLYLLV